MLRKLLIASAMVSVASLSGPSFAADKVTIPVIVKDTTSPYWQIVFSGARQAGKDLGVNVPELGAQSESDISGQISILENAVSEKPAAIVICRPNSRRSASRSTKPPRRCRSSASTLPRTRRPSPRS